MNQQFSRHWTWDNEGQWSLTERKQIMWVLLLPKLTTSREFPSWGAGMDNSDEVHWAPWAGKAACMVMDSEVIGVHGTTYQRGETCMEREFWKSTKDPFQICSRIMSTTHGWGTNDLMHGKNVKNILQKTILSIHIIVKTVPVSHYSSWKTLILWVSEHSEEPEAFCFRSREWLAID